MTEHFTLEELTRTHTGLPNDPPQELMENGLKLARLLEEIRKRLNVPLRVLSGYRSPRVNEAVGGVPNSVHTMFLAADFTPMGMKVTEAWRRFTTWYHELPVGQAIVYPVRWFIHVSHADAVVKDPVLWISIRKGHYKPWKGEFA